MAGGAEGMSGGAISGIVIGVLVLSAASAIAVWLLLHRKIVYSPTTFTESEMQVTGTPSWGRDPISGDESNSDAISRPEELPLEKE
jgi:hypothetical protein